MISLKLKSIDKLLEFHNSRVGFLKDPTGIMVLKEMKHGLD